MKTILQVLLSASLALPTVHAATQVQVPEQKQVTLAIKGQSLRDALNAWAQQTGFQLVSEMSGDFVAPSVQGTLTPQAALEQLLAGTPLTYEWLTDRIVAVRDKTKSSRATGQSAIDEANQGRLQFAQSVTSANSGGSHPADAAASDESAGQGNADSDAKLEEIVVTAQKRVERLIDVPQSVSVLSSDYLEKLSATQFRDFADTIPGLTYTSIGAGYTKVVLRGITTGGDVSPTVGIYVDEVPYGSSTNFANGINLGLDVGVFDIERIEVLRGPQGTLYGASTMGGLLKYVTRAPNTQSFGGNARAGLSQTQSGGTSYNASVSVNMPLVSDKLGLRAGGFHSHDGGYVDNTLLGDNDVNQSDIQGGRLDFLLTPTEAFSVRLAAFLQDLSRDGDSTVHYTPLGVPVAGDLEQRRFLREPFDQSFQLLSGTAEYRFERASLISISSYQDTQTDMHFDFTPVYTPFLPAPVTAAGLVYDLNTRRFTQEMRLASRGTEKLEWLIGGYYTDEESHNNILGESFNSTGKIPGNFYIQFRPSTYQEYAGFGSLTWHFTDRFDVTGGVRYADNEITTSRVGGGALGASTLPFRRSNDNVLTYLANARYRLNDRATTYARYATGYRPGGPNFAQINPATGLPVGPEVFEADELKNYEIGVKAETSNGRFGVDVGIFYIDWNNIQALVTRSGFNGIINAPGGATVRGVELAISTRPTRQFTATGSFAYQDAELSEASPELGTLTAPMPKGSPMPNVPKITAALNADYELPLGGLKPMIGATLRYVDDRLDRFGTTRYHLPSYTHVDLRAGLPFGSWQGQIFVRNLFDKRSQIQSAPVFGTTQNATTILQPRTIGISVTTAF